MVGCMALPSTCVPLCNSSQMALTTHGHSLLHNTKWMARGPGDLASCIGWLFCDHSFFFSLSNHNCLLFFLKPSFLPTFTSSCMLGDDPFGMELMFSASALSSFTPFQCLMVRVFQFCDVTMGWFFFSLIGYMMQLCIMRTSRCIISCI